MAITASRTKSPTKVRIGVFVYDGCSAWIVAGILELFEIANVVALRQGREAVTFLAQTVSPFGTPAIATKQIRFESIHPRVPLDVLLVPPIWHQSTAHLMESLKRLGPTLKRLPALCDRSRLVTSACSGAVLLAETGMLEGKAATTCWWLTDWFKKRYPNVLLWAERLLVTDGQTWTAAAGSAYINLGLRIIESFGGKELSRMTARLLLAEPNRETQAPYASPGFVNSDTDGPLSLLNSFVFKHIEDPISISDLASAAHMSVRSLFRYFEKHKGITPLEFVQVMRIERAKQLLELTHESVDSITPKCGYEDVSSFRKLFRKRIGMTPKQYRDRFGRFA
jgi:transcriptional regulator GlxA family with amidase domain